MWRLFLVLLLIGFTDRGSAEEKRVKLDERDAKVIESALLHLLTNQDFRLTGFKDRDLKSEVVLDVVGLVGRFSLSQRKAEEVIPKEVRGEILLRNEKAKSDGMTVSFVDLRPAPQIVIADLSDVAGVRELFKFEEAYPKARGYVSLHLPGFSKDGSQALIHGWIGPSSHGASMHALLELREGKWAVKWCKFWFNL